MAGSKTTPGHCPEVAFKKTIVHHLVYGKLPLPKHDLQSKNIYCPIISLSVVILTVEKQIAHPCPFNRQTHTAGSITATGMACSTYILNPFESSSCPRKISLF